MEDTDPVPEERFAKPDPRTAGELAAQLETTGWTKDEVLAHLEGAPILWSIRRLLPDEVTGIQFQIPDLMRSDGEWRWHQAVAYYVRKYDVRVPDDLLKHLLARAEDEDDATRA